LIRKSERPNLPAFYRFNFDDFESVDLREISNSLNLLFEQQIKTISLRELLRVGRNQSTLDLEILINKRTFREEVEDFVSVNSKNEIKYHHLLDVVVTAKKIEKESLVDYVFKTNPRCYLIDGRIWLGNKHLLLIQYKYRPPSEDLKKEANEVLKWVNEVKYTLKEKYPSHELIYLYITTSMIPEEQRN
jgi:hypothetical protein